MIRLAVILVVLLALGFVPLPGDPAAVTVGSKKFTESVIIGEMAAQLIEQTGTPARHYRQLGGTRLVYNALVGGEVDVYPEYTGTLTEEIFAGQDLATDEQLAAALARDGIRMSRPLGFNNTYGLGMLASRAEALGINTISDLLDHPDLALGFSNEFLDRQDGWPNLRQAYGLPQRNVRGMDHDLAYQQLEQQGLDVVDVYTTDARIRLLDLKVLADDRGFFPRYDAVLLYREQFEAEHPAAVASLLRLAGQIDEEAMLSANARAERDRVPEPQVAADFLAARLGVIAEVQSQSVASRIAEKTVEHLDLVRRSLIPAILVAVPIGIWASRRRIAGQVILSAVGLVQTIPALALLVMLMPVVAAAGLSSIGSGSATAIVALFLYSLLPIVRNTHAGLNGIAESHRESAAALGLPAWYRLLHVELPLASPSILAGIKTAAVINVGFATLGALVGAGGYGQPILTGIRLANTSLILQGAIPAAALALLVQGGFDVAERFIVPRGLRLSREQ